MVKSEPTPAPPAARRERRSVPVASVLERAGIPLLLVALVVFFGLSIGDVFTSPANLQNIFANQSVTGLIAIGMVVPLVAGYFDLSVAAIAGLASVTFAAVSGTYQLPIPVGIVAGLLVALIAGCLNAVLVGLVRLNPFITTFGTYVFFGGLLQLYTGGTTLGNGLPPTLGSWGTQRFLGIAAPFWMLVLIGLVVWYVLTQTPFGRKLAAIGSNEAAARLAGFRVDRAVFIAFLTSALLGGIAGCALTSRTLVADATSAQAYLFPALAAVFLGQTAIRPGHYNVWGTLFGVFLVAVAVNGLTLMGAKSWVTDVFNGAALVASVALSTLVTRGRERRAKAVLLQHVRGSQGST